MQKVSQNKLVHLLDVFFLLLAHNACFWGLKPSLHQNGLVMKPRCLEDILQKALHRGTEQLV